MTTQVNERGLALIREGEWVGLEAVRDSTGAWVIGYGHRKTAEAGQTITQADADVLLEEDLAEVEGAVSKAVTVPLNANEYSALVSLAFNIGPKRFAKSLLVKRLNAGDRVNAAQAFFWWAKARVGGRAEMIPGLMSRRAAEAALFLTPEDQPGQQTDGGTHVRPDKESPDRRRTLAKSRTIRGAGIAGIAGFISFLNQSLGLLNQLDPNNEVIGRLYRFFQSIPQQVYIVLGLIVIIASLYIAYVRWDDWRKGKR